jgi:hypothetical protein
MFATVSNRELFVADGDKRRTKSTKLANALVVELMRYGIVPDEEMVARIARQKRESARATCEAILKLYTIGELNPPLFKDWEDRTEFTFDEFVVQILGYTFQLSGNDLADPAFMVGLKNRVEFKKLKRLKLADDSDALDRFNRLVASKVALDKNAQHDLVALARTYFTCSPDFIQSAEARMAVVLGMVQSGVELLTALKQLNCQHSDALRYAAAKFDFECVKLPADVLYATLTWRDRIQLLTFLDGASFNDLCESMGNNREAWFRFFKHIHLFQQKEFRNRFTNCVAAALVSVGSKMEGIPEGAVRQYVQTQTKFYDVTEGGNLAYRTFASRVQSAVEKKDFTAFKQEIQTRPNHLLRNLGAFSNVCTRKTKGQFVELVRSMIDNASVGVLFSIVQIDVNAKYRIIDSKGNTTVTEANYNSVIGEIQGVVEREIYRRYGFEGKVCVTSKLKAKIVPFLSTNAELDRGSRIKFSKSKYLYFLMHWVQKANCRTDLDHSYVCLDKNWKAETIFFGNQANLFIKQSGDITNAPAPKGGTEYGRIDLKAIGKNVRYIVPIINVYSGDVFSENETAYAGFMFSDDARFSIQRQHTRYDLSQPANVNIPFIIDVKEQEIVIVDFNNRNRNGMTAHSSIGEIKKVISALKTKKFMTMERLAQMLSGDDSKTSLTIKTNASGSNEIEPSDLQSLFETSSEKTLS